MSDDILQIAVEDSLACRAAAVTAVECDASAPEVSYTQTWRCATVAGIDSGGGDLAAHASNDLDMVVGTASESVCAVGVRAFGRTTVFAPSCVC